MHASGALLRTTPRTCRITTPSPAVSETIEGLPSHAAPAPTRDARPIRCPNRSLLLSLISYAFGVSFSHATQQAVGAATGSTGCAPLRRGRQGRPKPSWKRRHQSATLPCYDANTWGDINGLRVSAACYAPDSVGAGNGPFPRKTPDLGVRRDAQSYESIQTAYGPVAIATQDRRAHDHDRAARFRPAFVTVRSHSRDISG